LIDSLKIDFVPSLEFSSSPHPAQWASSPRSQFARDFGQTVHGYFLSYFPTPNSKSPITLFISEQHIHSARLELPLMLSTSNSNLISSQAQIDAALQRFQQILHPLLVNPHGILDSVIFTRVDLVLQIQLPGKVASFLASLREVTHAKRKPTSYESGNIVWGNNKSSMKLTLYDKGLQIDRSARNILRIELRLTKGKLRELLGPSPRSYPTSLDFNRCYSAFRSQVLRFGVAAPRVVNFDSRNEYWSYVLASADKAGLRMPDGRSLFDALGDLYCPSAAASYRKNASMIQLASWSFDWASEFPEAWPPPNLAIRVPDPMERYSVHHRVLNDALGSPVPSPSSAVLQESALAE